MEKLDMVLIIGARVGEGKKLLGCVWGEWTGGEFDVGYRLGVLVCSVDSGRLPVNDWGK